ncbi:hypothetical protein [Caminibacter sp.]
MKKEILSIMIGILMPMGMLAGTVDLFSYDKTEVERALVDVDRLDQYVSESQITMSEMDLSNPLLNNMIYAEYMSEMDMSGSTAFFVGMGASCLAGCAGGYLLGCIGAIGGSVSGGLVAVLIASGSGSKATWNAVYGSLAGMALSIGTLLALSLLI